ncbi:MAG: hypothetical protein E7Z91_01780 [Cyanobacteria bacterium SIG30]|nr:hypothetical protein [Cyanobacteria bacterium SIG30]
MNESEINALFDITTDPIKNVYDLSTRDSRQEVERIIRIFNIVKEQRKTCSRISARGLVAFHMLVSNN